jgi:hypothetical protein
MKVKNVAIIKKEIVPTPSKKKPPRTTQTPCEDCDDEMETDLGVYGGIHAPGSKSQTLSIGSFGEFLYPWRNFEDDCSSEYGWAPGVYGSLYAYKASHSSSNGWGFRTTGDFGVRRNWLSDKELLRQWVFKFRPGIEYSHWGGDGNNHINQIGPTLGLYGEYRHELIEGKLQAWASAEAWFGLGDQDVSSNFSGIQPSSRLFTNFSVGLDYQLAPRWVLRGYLGVDYEGWSGEIPFVPGIELRHELFDRKGTISVGAQLKIYTALNPTAIVYAKYENNTAVPRWYEGKRQSSVKLVGKGIGGNQYRENPVNITNSTETSAKKASSVTFTAPTPSPGQASNSFTGTSQDNSSGTPAFDFSGPNRPHGDA